MESKTEVAAILRLVIFYKMKPNVTLTHCCYYIDITFVGRLLAIRMTQSSASCGSAFVSTAIQTIRRPLRV